MLTVLEIIKRTTEFLGSKGVEHPRLNAELIVGRGLGLKRMQLYLQFERPLTEQELEVIRPLVRRRAAREPLQYVLGETEFFGLTLKTDKRALIPRPETERLVELIIERSSIAPAHILDLGTGTGAIALALARQYPEAKVTAVDLSPDALALARENALANNLADRVTWLQSDWWTAIPGDARFDLIAANPPYLTEQETAEATPEVREHEPRGALVSGGAGGTADLAKIIARAADFLLPGGRLALETGIAQHAELLALLRERGYAAAESCADLTGRDRFVFAAR